MNVTEYILILSLSSWHLCKLDSVILKLSVCDQQLSLISSAEFAAQNILHRAYKGSYGLFYPRIIADGNFSVNISKNEIVGIFAYV